MCLLCQMEKFTLFLVISSSEAKRWADGGTCLLSDGDVISTVYVSA